MAWPKLSSTPARRTGAFLVTYLALEVAAMTADLLCSVLNQNVTAWRSAPAAVTIERIVVDWLAQAIACTRISAEFSPVGDLLQT